MSENNGMTVSNDAILDQKAAMTIQDVLNQAVQQGAAASHDLFPSLNTEYEGGKARNGKPATRPSRLIGLFRVQGLAKDAVASEVYNSTSDVLNLCDLETGQLYAFYASNDGAKAKIRGVGAPGTVVIISYRGKKESATDGFGAWADYGILSVPGEQQGKDLLATVNASLAKKKK